MAVKNNKQTALQMLIAWGDQMLKDNPPKVLSFAEVIDKAEELLQIEKEQIIKAHIKGQQQLEKYITSGASDDLFILESASYQYYDKTYNK